MTPFTRRPDPPLDFDETIALLQALFVGELLTIVAFPRSGGPTITMHGWSGEIEVGHHYFAVALGSLTTPPMPDDRLNNTLQVSRSQFRRAGELVDADSPGALGIELADRSGQHDLTLIVAARDVVPDWEVMRPA